MDPVVDLIVRVGLALVFATAAMHKLRDPAHFRGTVADYRVLPAVLVTPGSVVVVASEALAAALLVGPSGRTAGAVVAAALLLVYAAAIAINLARGRRHLDCGCAGSAARRPIGPGLLVRNLALAAGALSGVLPVAGRPLVWVDLLTVVAATGVLAATYAATDRLLAHAPVVARLRGGA